MHFKTSHQSLVKHTENQGKVLNKQRIVSNQVKINNFKSGNLTFNFIWSNLLHQTVQLQPCNIKLMNKYFTLVKKLFLL